MNILVVDDFCEYLGEVKYSALTAGLGTWNPEGHSTSKYSGIGYNGDHALMLLPLVLHTGRMLVPNLMFFRRTTKDTGRPHVHSDRESGDHTCVCYMSENSSPSGTAFYRHIPTGLTSMPSHQEMRAMGILEEIEADMKSSSPDKWEQIEYVESKKNRAVIFDSARFHSRISTEDTEEERLVWVAHYYHIDRDGGLV